MRGNQFGGFATYTEYLQGKHWKSLRKTLCLAAGSRCGACESRHHLQIHHVSYARLGCEHPCDLVVLCDTCHKKVHDELDRLYPGRAVAWQTARTRHIFPLLFERTLDQAQRHVSPKIAKSKKRKKRKKSRKLAKKPKSRYNQLPVNFAKSKTKKRGKKRRLVPIGAVAKKAFQVFRAKQPDVKPVQLQPRPEDKIPAVLAKMFGMRESRG